MRALVPSLCLALSLALSAGPAAAAENAYFSGKIAAILTYTYQDAILVRMVNQPTSHPACVATHFVIASSTTEARRTRVLSRLMTAYATGETVIIGYDNAGNCADGYIRIERVG